MDADGFSVLRCSRYSHILLLVDQNDPKLNYPQLNDPMFDQQHVLLMIYID